MSLVLWKEKIPRLAPYRGRRELRVLMSSLTSRIIYFMVTMIIKIPLWTSRMMRPMVPLMIVRSLADDSEMDMEELYDSYKD